MSDGMDFYELIYLMKKEKKEKKRVDRINGIVGIQYMIIQKKNKFFF